MRAATHFLLSIGQAFIWYGRADPATDTAGKKSSYRRREEGEGEGEREKRKGEGEGNGGQQRVRSQFTPQLRARVGGPVD